MPLLVPHSPFLQPASKIDQATYDAYAANWLKIVGEGGDQAALNMCFNVPSTSSAIPPPIVRLPLVSFTVAQIIEVLSAPGIALVKARFVVNNEKAAPNFGIVLFGVDNQGRRQTSYYLSDYQAGPSDASEGIMDVEVPDIVRRHWVNNWLDTVSFPLTRQLFATNYGPLQGFNFSLDDFMKPLMRARNPAESLHIRLGLHTFFGPSPNGEVKTASFGLLVRTPSGAGMEDDDDTSFDVAAPSPPAP